MMPGFEESTDPDCITTDDGGRLFSFVPWSKVVVVGDSVAAGVREATPGYRDLSAAQRVTRVLRVKRRSLTAINLAERGLVTRQIIETQLDRALDEEPDLVLVAAGGNDALRKGFEPVALEQDLEDLLGPLRLSGATVAILGLFDIARSGLVDDRYAAAMAERFDGLDAVTAALAERLGCVFVDLHRHPRSRDPDIFSSDRIHCNARGHAIAGAASLRALAADVASSPQPASALVPR